MKATRPTAGTTGCAATAEEFEPRVALARSGPAADTELIVRLGRPVQLGVAMERVASREVIRRLATETIAATGHAVLAARDRPKPVQAAMEAVVEITVHETEPRGGAAQVVLEASAAVALELQAVGECALTLEAGAAANSHPHVHRRLLNVARRK